jgi:hypothetical protein
MGTDHADEFSARYSVQVCQFGSEFFFKVFDTLARDQQVFVTMFDD